MENKNKLATPLDGFTVIEPDIDGEKVTSFGVIVSNETEKVAYTGTVCATTHEDLEEGQKVAFRKYAHDELTIDDKVFYVVGNGDILAVIQ